EPKRKNDTSDFVSTTFKFHAIYANEAACVAAYQEARGVVHTAQDDDPAMEIDMSAGAGAVDNSEYETAEAFLDVLVKTNTDPESLAKAIAGVPVVAKYFDVVDGKPARKAA